jgi:hypothetical protein
VRPRRAGFALAATLALAIGGCGRPRPATDRPVPLAVRVLSDLPAERASRVAAPGASVRLERVSDVRPAPLDLPPPDAPPDTAIPEAARAAADPALVPPILRAPAPVLVLPPGRPARDAESVDLEIEVDEHGRVVSAVAARGDSVLVAAAAACARDMRFLPARRGEVAVRVWCRQRFEFVRRKDAR